MAGAECGLLVTTDKCGGARSVNCSGSCQVPLSCGGGGAPNKCGFENPNWSILTVDKGGDAGAKVSLALDSKDQPHFAYEANGTDFRYALSNGGTGFTISNLEHGSFIYEFGQIAMDGPVPRIARRNLGALVISTPTGPSSVSDVQVSGFGGDYVDISYDAGGTPHLCDAPYNNIRGGQLRYATPDGVGGWRLETVQASASSAARVGNYCSIKVDSKGTVHIAYEDNNFLRMRYAVNDGTGWVSSSIEASDQGSYGSLALDIAEQPVVSYKTLLGGSIKVARLLGGTWTTKTIGAGTIAAYTSLVIDAKNKAHVAYFDAKGLGTLVMAHETSAPAWTLETVAVVGTGKGGYHELKQDSAGRFHIAFYDAAHQELRYAVSK